MCSAEWWHSITRSEHFRSLNMMLFIFMSFRIFSGGSLWEFILLFPWSLFIGWSWPRIVIFITGSSNRPIKLHWCALFHRGFSTTPLMWITWTNWGHGRVQGRHQVVFLLCHAFDFIVQSLEYHLRVQWFRWTVLGVNVFHFVGSMSRVTRVVLC